MCAKNWKTRASLLLWFIPVCFAVANSDDSTPPAFDTTISPLLTKYCIGCHNKDDRAGDLSLESYGDLQNGLENRPLVLAGQADSSRLVRVLTGQTEPKMPPEDNPSPTNQEITLLRDWINAGAIGPDDSLPSHPRLVTPSIRPTNDQFARPITALALSPGEQQLVIARFGSFDVLESIVHKLAYAARDLPGKIHAVNYSPDGSQFVVATGIAGLYGEAQIYEADAGKILRTFTGHRDILYDADFSPDGRILATASYDHTVILWNVENGQPLNTLIGHNGAIYDLAFSRDGNVLATASGDETIKLWHVATGKRLDTLSQPLAEQYCVAFSPDGRHIAAGGGDRRIRVWQFESHDTAKINPLIISRFAHEKSILKLAFTPDSRVLISTAADLTIQLWDTETFSRSSSLEPQPDVVTDLCMSNFSQKLVVGRLDGSWEIYPIELHAPVTPPKQVASPDPLASSDNPGATVLEIAEIEPNDSPREAQPVDLPVLVKGVIQATKNEQRQDVDLFRFSTQSGQQWIIEINAMRNGSPLDSKIEVLSSTGDRIERMLLQAVRDSYMTFIGRNSDDLNGFRLHNWEEMELNEYLYAAGEVMKLWHYPRGPDSGFILYPGTGKRFSYFGTTALSHALNESVYIVEPHPPGTQLKPTGLPTFKLFYENDDESFRRLGKDSMLAFVAPADGEYLVRVRDVRGLGGESYHYEMSIRPPQPDFEITVTLEDATIHAGAGREFSVAVNRQDGFDGDISVHIDELPPGFYASSPVVVQSGQTHALGTINVVSNAPQPTEELASASRVTASAIVAGHQVSKPVGSLGTLKLGDPLPVRVSVVPRESSGGQDHADTPPNADRPPQPVELVIAPGETISAFVRLDRNDDFADEVRLGGHDSGRNLPHGVYVDNIGLSGLLVNAGSSQREIFITAAKWVPTTSRLFHLRANVNGQQTSWPVLLRVQHADLNAVSP